MFPRVIPISCTQVEVHVFRRHGKRLELLLIRRSPQRSLAGVWQPVTGGIERGERSPALANIGRLARALGVHVRELFNGGPESVTRRIPEKRKRARNPS